MGRSWPLLLLLFACARAHGDKPSATGHTAAVRSQDEVLRRELLERLEADQAVRFDLLRNQPEGRSPDSLGLERLLAVDTANTAWLKGVVTSRGWPGRSLVGADAANAAFVLVQHADRDTAFQARVLPLLERARAAGEAEGQHVALLTDRLAIARGLPQVYGSQADITDGRIVLKPIRDSASVDARRARIGLPSLAEYVRLLDSVYSKVPNP
jgi:hypothetical protein